MATWDRSEWNKPFLDGDARMYSRDCFRAFYTAWQERQRVSGGGDPEAAFGWNPVDDTYSRPACVGLSTFGGLGYLWEAIPQVVGQYPVNGFSSFGDPSLVITASDDVLGSSWSPDLSRAKLVAAVGKIRRVTPLLVGGFPNSGTDQYGRPVAVGARGHVRIAAHGNFPNAGTQQLVAEWDGTVWKICDPQWSARADMLDTEKGTLDPVYDPEFVDESGEPLTNPETGQPYEPTQYRDVLLAGDYLGAHLWQQTRDTFNLCHQFNSVVNGRTSYFANWPALVGETATTVITFSANGNFGQRNAGTGPEGFAAILAGAQANWDANAGSSFLGNSIPFAYGSVDGFWRINPAGPFDAPNPNYYGAYNIRLDGARAEVWWQLRYPGYNAAAEAWVYARKPPFDNPAGVTFDAMDTGLIENQWNQLYSGTIPAGGPTLDPNPFSGFYDWKTGAKVGERRAGHYPPAVAPPLPPKPAQYPDPAPTTTYSRSGYIVGTPNNGTHPVGTLDYAVAGGFTFY